MKRVFGYGGAVLMASGILGCSKHPAGSIALRVSPEAPGEGTAGAVRMQSRADTAMVVLGKDTLFIREASLVVRDVEIAPAAAGDCEGSPEEHEEECPSFAVGPIVLQVPLVAAVESVLVVRVPPGGYSLLQFQVQVPDPERDSAFLITHPEFRGSSVRLRGVLSRAGHRSTVTYAFAFNEREQLELSPPLAAESDTTTLLTLHIDIAAWFLDAARTALVDPSTAVQGQPQEGLVRDNIRMSLTARPSP